MLGPYCIENVENVACVWPAHSTHATTSCNNFTRCFVEMLRAFGQALRYMNRNLKYRQPVALSFSLKTRSELPVYTGTLEILGKCDK